MFRKTKTQIVNFLQSSKKLYKHNLRAKPPATFGIISPLTSRGMLQYSGFKGVGWVQMLKNGFVTPVEPLEPGEDEYVGGNIPAPANDHAFSPDSWSLQLSKMDYGQRDDAIHLLSYWNAQGLPDDFFSDNVTIQFDPVTKNVFLTNADFQVAMINPESDLLESVYTCSQCGAEGFADELDYNHLHKACGECAEKMARSGVGVGLPSNA